jgi:hypothetical protein
MNLSRMVVIVAVSQMLLAGCATEAEMRQRDEAACNSYGFHQGTTEFAACLQRERLARRYGYGYYDPYWP